MLSALERCTSYKPWFDRQTNRARLLTTDGKCLHYYFYFLDADYGWCYARVPTWCPFRLQVYFNGHGYLDQQLSQRAVEHSLVDNAFSTLDAPQDGIRSLDKVTRPVRQNGRSSKGFNFFLEDDMDALLAVIAGQNAIRGFPSRDLTEALPDLSSSQRSRLIKRLRTHGISKKVAYTDKYYLSSFGNRVVAAGLHLKTFILTPQLCATAPG